MITRKSPIFIYCWILGILDITNSGLAYKLYSGLILTFNVSILIIQIVMNWRVGISTGLQIVGKILTGFLIAHVLLTTIPLVFWFPHYFQRSINIINQFDRYFSSATTDKGIIIFALALVDTSFMSSFHMALSNRSILLQTKEYFLGKGIQRITMGITYYLRIFLVQHVTKRFRILNDYLETIFEDHKEVDIISRNHHVMDINIIKRKHDTGFTKMLRLLDELKRISKFHNLLCDVLDMINALVGLGVMCEVFFCTALVSESAMNLVEEQYEFTENGGVNRRVFFIIIIVNVCVSTFFFLY